MRFKGKNVWITGASSGIGEALAIAFAKEGAHVILSARREEELKRVAAICGEGNTTILPLDLAATSGIEDLTQSLLSKLGHVDVLVNNGGISQRELAIETPLEVDRKIMEVNFFGQIAVTKSVLPGMLKRKSGHIVVISSIAGKFGFWYRSAYSASKHALQGFFEVLRLETDQQGIKVLIAVPGKIRTNISLHALKGDGRKHAVMDKSQEEGMSAEECARIIIDSMLANREEVLIGGREIKAVWIKRHFPKLFGRIIRKQPKE